MVTEKEPMQKNSWALLREKSYAWWNTAGEKRHMTKLSHPDELAEHVVFGIIYFVINHSENPESDAQIEALKTDIKWGRYEDVIDKGEAFYRKQFLPKNPDAEKSLVVSLFNSAVAVPLVA